MQVLHGKQFAYPIYFDLEEKKQFALGKQVCSEMVEAFCSTLEQAGYYAGLYCSTFYLENYVTESVRNRYTVWCADYTSECGYSGDYGIWQKGCGTISGINGNVDLDECYIDYPTIIKNAGLNGFAKNATTTNRRKSMNLPYSEQLNIGHFGRFFDNTSECYKFFWFKAILSKISEGKTEYTYEELVDEMIAEAWLWIFYCST